MIITKLNINVFILYYYNNPIMTDNLVLLLKPRRADYQLNPNITKTSCFKNYNLYNRKIELLKLNEYCTW